MILNSLHLSTHILFVFCFDSSTIFSKALVIIVPYLPFKGVTHACFL